MKQKLCIVIPQHKEELSDDEKFSLESLIEHKGDVPIIKVKPQSLQKGSDRTIFFEDSYFESIYSYSKLLISKKFWESFTDFEYILIYQLDCLIFKPNLLAWCDRGWDYIGAPWVTGYADEGESFMGVGNGGFSLRNVQKSIDVFNTLGVSEVPIDSKAHEDVFWCQWVPQSLPFLNFKIAPIDEAKYFAVETGIELNKKLLKDEIPTGAHAWTKRNPDYLRSLVCRH